MTEAILQTPAASAVKISLTRRIVRDPMALGALITLAIIVAVTLAAPLLTPWDPTRADLASVLAPPFGDHVLGADSAGRDILARLLFGGQVSLMGALVALSVALLIGIPSGLVAGYFQGAFDSVSSWSANLFMSLPGLIVLLAVISVVGPQMPIVMAVFGVLLSPGVFRLTRSGVLSVRKELYIDAAKVSGLRHTRIITRHVLGVIRAPLVIQASIMAGIAIVLQAGLEFLGVGDSATPSWGQMLNDAFLNIYVAPHMLIWPGVMIGITVGALAIFGAALRDVVQGANAPSRRRRTREGQEDVPPVVEPALRDDAPRSSTALLSIDALRVGYRQPDGATTVVVDGVSLEIERGTVLGLVGESGSGKTQTAFAVLGLLPHGGRVVGGTISFDGISITADTRSSNAALRGRRIAYVPQEPMSNLDPSFTVGFQLVEPMRRVLKISSSEARERALSLLDRVGIADPKRTFAAYPHEISGGMAQRVLIAGAVSCDPELLIADEPTTALDVTVQAEVLDVLRDLQQERGMAVLIVSHNFGVVADVCDRVAVMQHGRIVEQGSVEEIFDDPRHPYTRMLLDSTLEGTPARPPLGTTKGATQ